MHDCCNDAQSQPIAFPAMMTTATIKRLHDGLHVMVVYTATAIGDIDARRAILLEQANLDDTALSSELDGVVNQIADCLQQQAGVGGDHSGGTGDHGELYGLVFRQRLEQFGNLAQHIVRIDQLKPSFLLPILDFRNPQQRAETP